MMTTEFKPNRFLQLIYVLAILAMFAFFYLLIKQYAKEAPVQQLNQYTSTAAAVADIVEQTTDHAELNTPSKADNASAQFYQMQQAIYLNGQAFRLQLNKNVAQQIEDAWYKFASNSKLLTQMPLDTNRHQVVVGYYDYSEKSQQVNMLIGYMTEQPINLARGYDTITLPKGKYYQADSVFTIWQQAKNLPFNLSQDTAYEIYLLDDNYAPLSQKAYALVK